VKGDTSVVAYLGGDESREVTEEITISFLAPARMVGRVIERVDGEASMTTDPVPERQS
jgi:hypothetical protein